MAGLILIGLIIVLIIYLLVAKRKKRALIISAVILGAYMLYVRFTCGPDPRDVKVMKPMAEAISDYIIKHGVPESLRDIPNLPYRLEGCERKEEYWKTKIVGADRVNNIKDATRVVYKEKCNFKKNNRTYVILLDREIGLKIHHYDALTLRTYQYDSLTGIDYELELDVKGNHWKMRRLIGEKDKNIHIYSNNTSGICNPMRQ